MYVEHVKSVEELDHVLKLARSVFPNIPQNDDGDDRYSRTFWLEKFHEMPELLLYARDDDRICGSVFAWVDNQSITIGHCFVDKAYQGNGIGKLLMLEIEKRVASLGYHDIVLGSLEEAEGFYQRLGYTGVLLIQSEHDSIDELRSLNSGYEEVFTNIYEAYINQLCLRVPGVDRELQRRYEKVFPNCHTQMIFSKKLQA